MTKPMPKSINKQEKEIFFIYYYS